MKMSYKVAASVVLLGLLVTPARGQEPAAKDLTAQINGYERAAHSAFVGVPTDWSTGHIVFSPPESGSAAEGKVQQDPRYWLQQIRRSQLQSEDSIAGASEVNGLADGALNKNKKNKKVKIKKVKIKKDWSVSLGAAGAKVGAGFFPAKYSFGTSGASCSDYVAFNTSLAGAAGQASIIAFNNLYATTCAPTVPTVAWAYNTGGTILTSLTLSSDGTQVAFVHSAAGAAKLEILRPINGQGTSATAPVSPGTSSTTGSAYVTCKAGSGSCLLSLAFGDAHNDTNSSPFYVYVGTNADTIFVGDDSGFLHKFTGVFKGTPAEVTTGIWPVQTAVAKMSGTIYDDTSGTVFLVTSYDGAGNGSRLHEANVSTGAVGSSDIMGPHTSGEPNTCAGTGTTGSATAYTADAPIVDSTAARVYTFLTSNGSGNSIINEYVPGFASGTCGTQVTVGTASTSGTLYSGAFDNIYFSSVNAASPSGNLYVCGNPGGNATFYRIPIVANAIGAPSAVATALSTATTTCSPVTEFLNGSTDQAFVSVQASGNTNANIGCPATGCIMAFNITAGTTPTATSSRAGESGGTSGIVIDNSSGVTGASQVYFSTLTGSTAIQDSQSGL